jgi:glucose 1-dehydrogenase
MPRLASHTAIVTGSSSGIGQAIAIRLAKEGANVVVDYIGHSDGAKETLHRIEEAGASGIIVQADISKLDDTQKLINQAWDRFGCADILINNAGLERKADFWDVSPEDFDKVLSVNLRGPYFLAQAFVRCLRDAKKPGKIVNISSVHEDMAFPGFSTYCISKGGMRMMTRNLSVELAPLGITINNVAPGAIATPINQALMNDKPKLEALLTKIPIHRMGTPEEVAGLVAFLASQEADYITGSTLTIDGGLTREYHEQ